MAPELLEYCYVYDSKVDIWALGWTFYKLLYGVDPWLFQNERNPVGPFISIILKV